MRSSYDEDQAQQRQQTAGNTNSNSNSSVAAVSSGASGTANESAGTATGTTPPPPLTLETNFSTADLPEELPSAATLAAGIAELSSVQQMDLEVSLLSGSDKMVADVDVCPIGGM